MMRVNAKMVSFRQTYHPLILVNISATKNGWDKNLSVFLALATRALSWLDNSSNPRIAIREGVKGSLCLSSMSEDR